MKSIERVQGDERDVVILSTGYHKAENGTLPYRFGVVGQGKCPGKCSAEMSLRYAAMVSDVDGLGTIRCFHPGGPPASR